MISGPDAHVTPLSRVPCGEFKLGGLGFAIVKASAHDIHFRIRASFKACWWVPPAWGEGETGGDRLCQNDYFPQAENPTRSATLDDE